jgi:hypothetical protein
MEGAMVGRVSGKVGVGERAAVVRHGDQLRLEGKMESRQVGAAAAQGERFGVVRRADNLKVEGGRFEGRSQATAATASTSVAQSGATSHRSRANTNSSIVVGDDSSAMKTSTKATASSKMTASSRDTASSKATVSSLVLAGGEAGAGSISAVNR